MIPFEISFLRVVKLEVWDYMRNMVQGQGSLEGIIIAKLDQTARKFFMLYMD